MCKTKTINGSYRADNTKKVSTDWEQICADHEEEFPMIYKCTEGTFNIITDTDENYEPPDDAQYRVQAKKRGSSVKRYEHGNHISPRAKVTAINGIPVEAWIYRGGNPEPHTLELLSCEKLADVLNVKNEDKLKIVIMEVDDGACWLPKSPSSTPGRTIRS